MAAVTEKAIADEKARKRYAYASAKAAGACTQCKTGAAVLGRVWCDTCLSAARTVEQRRKAEGLCVACGKIPAEPDRVRCVACLAYASAKQEKFRQRNPEAVRISKLRKYGLSRAEYLALLARQNGLCALCGRPPVKLHRGGTHLAVDHDHETGAVRGLLCTNCNTGLGCFRDDSDLLGRAIEYLRRHGLRSVKGVG
jgi:hypothetical protein